MNYFGYKFTLRKTATILSTVITTLVAIATEIDILIGSYYQSAAGDVYKSLAKINQTIPYSYVLSIVAIALSVTHLDALVSQEQKNILLQQLEKLIAPISFKLSLAKVKNAST